MTFSNWIEVICVFASALIATIALTPLAKKIAIHFDAIDYPDKRRVNVSPIPRMGGIAIFGGICISCIVMAAGRSFFGWFDPFHTFIGQSVNYWLLALGVTIMFGVGLYDDIKNMKARYKLIGQIISCTIVSSSGLVISFIQNPFDPGSLIHFGILSWPITIFYLVAFANVINLIDGLDGLASGISMISALAIAIYGVLSARVDAILFSAILVGCCLGFLKSNYHPASIFMGDSGSLILGLCLGIISLVAIARAAVVFSLLVPLLAAGVPITDTAVAIIRRKRAHEPVNAPDKGHIHHRLMDAGFSQKKTVWIMWIWTAVLSACGLAFAELDGLAKPISLILAASITGFAIFKLELLTPVLKHYYHPRKRRKSIRREEK